MHRAHRSFTGSWLLLAFATAAAAQTLPETLELARAALKLENVARADELAHAALAQAPESAAVQVLLGEVDFRMGAIPAAELDFQKALRLDPKQARAWLGMGRVLQCASYYKRSKSCFQTARELDPADAEIRRAWAATVTGAPRIAALEAYLAALSPSDAEEIERARLALELAKHVGDRKLFRLSGDYAGSEIKLLPLLYSPRRARGFAVSVSIDGSKPLKLLLDTGASGIVINSAAAQRIGLQKLTQIKVGGIGDEGDRDGYTALAERLEVGPVQFADALIEVSDKRTLGDVEGLIGTDIFSRYLVTLDFWRAVLRLDALPGQSAQASDSEPHDREIAPEMKSFAPVFRFGHSLLIATQVSGSKPVLFLIDTGSSISIIGEDMARQVAKVHGDSNAIMHGISGKVKNVFNAENLTLLFAGFQQRSKDAITISLRPISKSLGVEVSGILGLPLLNYFVVKIDYRDGLVGLNYIGPIR